MNILKLENTFEDLLCRDVKCVLDVNTSSIGAVGIDISEWHFEKDDFETVRYEINDSQAMELSNVLVNLVRNNLAKART